MSTRTSEIERERDSSQLAFSISMRGSSQTTKGYSVDSFSFRRLFAFLASNTLQGKTGKVFDVIVFVFVELYEGGFDKVDVVGF